MLEAQGIRKAYGGVVALRDVNFTLRPGSVHALLGENGAGKSTLVKIIAGAIRPDEGVLRLDGQEVSFSSTADAARHGVAVVSQELSLFPDLDVLANLFPMREQKRGPFVSRAAMSERALPVLAELGLNISLRRSVATLSLAERQLLETARALVTDPRVLVLDEPTSALEQSKSEMLLGILRVLRDRNVAVVFVSHILEEVVQLCDQVTVLRDGEMVLDGVPLAQLGIPDIVQAMLGEGGDPRRAQAPARAAQDMLKSMLGKDRYEERMKRRFVPGASADLVIEDVTVDGVLEQVSLNASPGEVVGLAGLVGAGQHACLELIAGLRSPQRGRVLLPGGVPAPRGLPKAIGAGVALASGDRRRFGLMLDKSVWENVGQVRSVALARDGSFIRSTRLRQRAREHTERLRVRTPSVEERTGLLSGGNQQKVVFAKWLDASPSVLLLDDPTRGVDVGAKAEMHTLIRSVADAGAVVLLCSTDIDELADVCDRVIVFHRGRVCTEFSGAGLTGHALLEAMNTGEARLKAASAGAASPEEAAVDGSESVPVDSPKAEASRQ